MIPTREKGLSNKYFGYMSILLFLIAWEILPRTSIANASIFVAPPSTVIRTLIQFVREGTIFEHVFISLQRSVTGFLLSVIIGIRLGFILGGWFKTIEKIIYPLLKFLSSFNPFSLFPVFILLFGIGEISKISMIFWFCIWPIVFNTITGIKELDPLVVKSSRSMGAGKLVIFSKVAFPYALPYIFTGLKMSCSSSFFMLIASEMIGASSGLGWLVINSQVNFQYDTLYTTTVIIAFLGIFFNNLFKVMQKKVITWKGEGEIIYVK